MFRKIKTWLFIKHIDPSIRIKHNPYMFCYDHELNTLYYNFEKDEYDLINKTNEIHNTNIPQEYEFIFSLLHEVGHKRTGDFLTPAEIEQSQKRFKFISTFGTEILKHSDSLQRLYYQVPEEYLASDYAIVYLKTNPNFCKKWVKRLNK